MLGYFGKKESIPQKRHQRFVNSLVGEEYESPLKDVVSSTLLGNADFISYIKETFPSDKKPDMEKDKKLRRKIEKIEKGIRPSRMKT